MKIAFLGSSQFSLIVLQALTKSSNDIVCVVTNPDKQVGRGGKVVFSPVKQFAIDNNIPIIQCSNVSNEKEQELKAFNPDVLITASFSHFLKSNILNLAPMGVVNVHPSLLPKFRGASPIASAILAGEKQTGVTIMKTVNKMDAGPILSQIKTEIKPQETAGELTLRLANLGAELLIKTLNNLQNGSIKPISQEEGNATFCAKLTKENSQINFNSTVENIINMCNAYNPWPVTFVQNQITKEIIKVYNIISYTQEIVNKNINVDNFKNGQVVLANAKVGLVVKCQDGFVLLNIIQSAGGKAMLSKNYLNGKKIEVGTQF